MKVINITTLILNCTNEMLSVCLVIYLVSVVVVPGYFASERGKMGVGEEIDGNQKNSAV